MRVQGLLAWALAGTVTFGAAANVRPSALTSPIYSMIADNDLATAEATIATHDTYALSPETPATLAVALGKIVVVTGLSSGPPDLSVAVGGRAVGLAMGTGAGCRAAAVAPSGRVVAVHLPARWCSGADALRAAPR